jgi:hypothetical protein
VYERAASRHRDDGPGKKDEKKDRSSLYVPGIGARDTGKVIGFPQVIVLFPATRLWHFGGGLSDGSRKLNR